MTQLNDDCKINFSQNMMRASIAAVKFVVGTRGELLF